ncbi:MAG TPA: ABC transporter permease [Egibacteraceae bacterium]|nr:ABC transporter permease [Egibacteraceae bacterium]
MIDALVVVSRATLREPNGSLSGRFRSEETVAAPTSPDRLAGSLRSVATPTVQAAPRPGPPPQEGRVRRLLAAVAEVWAARELTGNLVRRDLKVRHRGTFLGMLWSLTTPLLIVALYYCIFKFLFRGALAQDVSRPDGHDVPFAVYFFCGLTIWNLFASGVSASTGSVIESGYLLNKVYFPRAILPIASVLSALVTFVFEFAVLAIITLITVGPPSVYVLWVPVIVAVVLLQAVGLALLLSAVTVYLRDMVHFIGLLMQVWFWSTPVIYSLIWLADGSPRVAKLVKANPMTGTVVSFRNVVVLNHPPPLRLLAYGAACAVVMLVIGTTVFARSQRRFSEIV